jgi:tripartite-type tricarboxylate transporter receptor subunit TctC
MFKEKELNFAFRAAICSALIAAPAAAHAQASGDFYKGKTLTIMVSTEAGTLYDFYARGLQQFLPDALPGHPTVIVENMPGASGQRVGNFVYSVAPKDGTVIAAVHAAIPTQPLFTPDTARFDPKKIEWIGSAAREPFVGFVRGDSPIHSIEDLKTKELIVGGVSLGSTSVDMAIVMRDIFGLKLKIVTGYKSSLETKLAIEKHELDGTFGNAWTSVKTELGKQLADGSIRVITQFGAKRLPDLPDVPIFSDIARTPEERAMLDALLARQEFAKPYFAPPGVPAERIALLRAAFDSVMKNPSFIAEMEKRKLPLDPMNGPELAAYVSKVMDTPPAVVERLRTVFANFKN